MNSLNVELTLQYLRRKNTGFSLLEVLVALLILSIGLLGVARLQAMALRFSSSTDIRVAAIQLSQDMIERVRANSVGAKLGEYSSGSSLEAGTCNHLASSSYGTSALADIAFWRDQIACQLPSGKGSLSITVGSGSLPSALVVKVQWDDSRLKGGSTTQSYSARTLF